MRIDLLKIVDGDNGLAGTVKALAVDPPSWELIAVLVEPLHRLGLGKWVPASLVQPDDEGSSRCPTYRRPQ